MTMLRGLSCALGGPPASDEAASVLGLPRASSRRRGEALAAPPSPGLPDPPQRPRSFAGGACAALRRASAAAAPSSSARHGVGLSPSVATARQPMSGRGVGGPGGCARPPGAGPALWCCGRCCAGAGDCAHPPAPCGAGEGERSWGGGQGGEDAGACVSWAARGARGGGCSPSSSCRLSGSGVLCSCSDWLEV